MPEKIKSVLISIGQKEVYRPGDTVKGFWELTSEKQFTTKGIISTFQGCAFVKWTETDWTTRKYEDDEYIAHEVYFTQTLQLRGRRDVKEEVMPGVYKYPFSYTIPYRPVPSSYEGPKGAIRYMIHIRIRRPIPFPDVTRYKCITVLEEIDVNLPAYIVPLCYKRNIQVPKVLGLGNAGTVELWGKTDRKAYCPGEQIALSFTAKNTSNQNLGKIRAQLIQYVTFKANGKTEYSNSIIYSVTSKTELEASKVFKWTELLIRIDAVPATIDAPTCHIVTIHYVLEVTVSVPLFTGKDMKLVFPVTIGTIPLGKSIIETSQEPGEIPVFDASKAITYTKCNKGWSNFNKSSSSRDFPNLNYTPMCAYEAGYDYKKLKAIKASKASKSASSLTNTSPQTSASSTNKTVKHPAPTPNSRPGTLSQSSTATGTTLQKPGDNQTSSNANASGAQRLTPTAPPLSNLDQEFGNDLLPPSYEEATGLQDSSVENTSDNEDDGNQETSGDWYMMIRLPKASVDDLLEFVKNNKKLLEVHEGRLLLKSTKQYKPIGDWTLGRYIVMLVFPSKEKACDWIKSTPGIPETKWWPDCDVIVTPVSEQYQEGKTTLTVSEISRTENIEAVTRYRNLINNIIRPIRILHGGIQLVKSPSFEVLHGKYRTNDKSIMSILAWPDFESVKKYKSSLAELQATIDELKKQAMVIHSSSSFNVSSLSPEDV